MLSAKNFYFKAFFPNDFSKDEEYPYQHPFVKRFDIRNNILSVNQSLHLHNIRYLWSVGYEEFSGLHRN
jgi:hypothetical protein